MKDRYEVKITSKGQLTLPKRLREKLSVGKGSRVVLETREKELVLKPVRVSVVDRLAGIGKTDKSSRKLHEEFVKEVESRSR